MSNKQVEAVREYCRKYLSCERFQHVLRVYETMREINAHHGWGLGDEQLALAGFGHDIARELPDEVLLLLLENATVSLGEPTPWERESPLFCHNKVGVLLLQKCFGVNDADVLQAVAHHTLGAAGLCQLARLLYIADFLEPKRPFLRAGERQIYIAMELKRSVYEICLRMAKFWQSEGKPLLPPTRAMILELERDLEISPTSRFVSS